MHGTPIFIVRTNPQRGWVQSSFRMFDNCSIDMVMHVVRNSNESLTKSLVNIYQRSLTTMYLSTIEMTLTIYRPTIWNPSSTVRIRMSEYTKFDWPHSSNIFRKSIVIVFQCSFGKHWTYIGNQSNIILHCLRDIFAIHRILSEIITDSVENSIESISNLDRPWIEHQSV